MSIDYLPWDRPASFDDRPCVRDAKSSLTYAEFAERVDAAAEQFAELGVAAGSVVAIMLPNQVDLTVAMVASWRLGAAATPINPVFTASEAGYQIQDAKARLIVNVSGHFANAECPVVAADELRTTRSGQALPAAHTSPEDLALLIYTSGSTGRPKGVMLDHANLAAMASMLATFLGITSEDHCLLILPLFHVNAICASFLAPLTVGAQLTILERFRPTEFLDAIEEFRPTYFSAVPTIFSLMLAAAENREVDTSSVRFAGCGAAPAPVGLLDAVAERFGFQVVEAYGLSEGTCGSTCGPLGAEQRPGSVGIALPSQTVAIMGLDGRVLPPGERGEVVIQGPNVMQGYLNNPDATADALGDGWLHTGDVGVMDADGYLWIVDRIKDMIIRGGENLYPKEIEDVLYGHPSVLEAAVIGAPSEVYGEVPVAFVAGRPGVDIVVEEVLDTCREHLTKIKVPVSLVVLETLPKNPIGKIDKPRLRALHAAAEARSGG